MRIADFVHDSIVDGPGFRFTLFTQGCPHHCEGCHNPQTHDPDGGKEVSVDEIIRIMLSNPLTDGLTLSGGDPFFQPEDCAAVARAAKAHGLNVWTYSGWTFEQLELTDVLVDGPFVLSQRSLSLKWRGSRNQRLIDVPKSLQLGEPVLWEKTGD